MTFAIRLTPLNNIFGHLLIIICRIPVYVFGLYMGKYVEANKVIRVNIGLVLAVSVCSMGIVLLAAGVTSWYMPFAFKYLAYCPLAIIISGLLSYAPPSKVLEFLGTDSLETYLLHEKVLWLLENLMRVAIPEVYAQYIAQFGINFWQS